jgi:hypothetical protein
MDVNLRFFALEEEHKSGTKVSENSAKGNVLSKKEIKIHNNSEN